ncbi:MAG: DUF1064 domain-containing protein [Ketobacter sp.]|nr:DUF1064 domain-containing protein [Ketobacter sp.]
MSDDVRRLNPELTGGDTPPKRNKWNATKTEVDGIVFDSKHEARRYVELKMLETSGAITHLELQPEFILQPAFTDCTGKHQRAIKYRADFRYMENEQSVIEDAKGALTPIFRLKRKLFMYKFDMEIRLT